MRSTTGNRTWIALAALLSLGGAGCGVSEREERALGDEYAAEIEKRLPILAEPAITAYVTALGERIGSGAGRPIEWHFSIVNAADVNAFAIPGGHIYVNRGLIERTRNVAELAGVLGHEIGHVVLRHSAEQIGKQRTGNVVIAIVCSFTSFCSNEAARVAINIGGAAIFARYSRKDELEADSAGIALVTRSGYDPHGIPSFFEVLLAQRAREPAAFETWFGTHPLEETRIRRAESIIASLRLPGTLTKDDPEFEAFKRRLTGLPPSPKLPAPQP